MKQVRLMVAILAMAAGSAAAQQAWLFNTAGDLEGWTNNGATSFTANYGSLNVTYPAGDPFVVSPVFTPLAGSSFPYIRIDMEVSTAIYNTGEPFQIFFDTGSGFNETESVWFNLTGASQRIYTINLSSNTYWTGASIQRVRLDLGGPLSAGSVRIHNFSIVSAYIMRVTPTGNDINTGSGWTNSTAKKTLKGAIDALPGGGEIWVKQGFYEDAADPSCGALMPRDDIKIYGGFYGWESSRTSYARSNNPETTIISGLRGIGGTTQAYNVFRIAGHGVRLECLAICNGNARANVGEPNSLGPDSRGGGVYSAGYRLEIINCAVRDNDAFVGGGGICIEDSAQSQRQHTYVTDCYIYNNNDSPVNTRDTGLGGGLNICRADTKVEGCLFYNNMARYGGAVYTVLSWRKSGTNNFYERLFPEVKNCLIYDNRAIQTGGGIYIHNADTRVVNCTLVDNGVSQQAPVEPTSTVGAIAASNATVLPRSEVTPNFTVPSANQGYPLIFNSLIIANTSGAAQQVAGFSWGLGVNWQGSYGGTTNYESPSITSMFRNYGANDFRPATGSTVIIDQCAVPAVPALPSPAHPAFTITRDVMKTTRPQGASIDRGAYEYELDLPAAPGLPDLASADDSGASNTDDITRNTTNLTFTGAATAQTIVSLYVDGAFYGQLEMLALTSYRFELSLAEGVHTLYATATDYAGNVSPASGTLTVTIDTTAPTVTVNQAGGQADPTNASPIDYAIQFNEAINPATFVGTDVAITGTAGGTKTVTLATGDNIAWTASVTGMTSSGTVIATMAASVVQDIAGNGSAISTSTDNQVTFDNDAPTVTINQAVGQADPTNVASIAFAVAFSEAINPATFTGADVLITGSAGGTKSVALSTADNQNWTATVTGMTSSGTVIANIAANAVQDPAGNNNEASTSADNQVTYDNVRPSVTINQAVGQADPTNVASVDFTVVFSEVINPATFTGADVAITGTAGGTKSVALSTSDNQTWTATVTGMTSTGTVIANIAANAVQDPAGNNNTVSTSTDNQVTYDITSPGVSMSSAAPNPTNTSPIPVTVTFTENVTGFIAGDIVPGNAVVGGFTPVSGTVYTFTLTPILQGPVTADIGAGVCIDAAGNGNTAAAQFSRTFDNVAPTVTINQAGGQADPENAVPILFTVVFSEPINPATFTGTDVAISGSAGGTKTVTLSTSDNRIWTASVTGVTSSGTVIANIAANAAQDPAGNNSAASTSTDNQVTFDNTAPTVTINQAGSQADPTNVASIAFTIVFSEAINPATFTGADVAISGSAGGTKSVALSTADNQTWTATVTGMTSTGTVIANIAANAAQDPAGNNSAASTSTDNQVTYDITPPTVTINQAGLQADPTNVASIAFTIVFSEAINPATFTGADVAISGSAGGTKSVALSTADNQTWTATVTGMTSTGTVLASIAVNAAQDPAGNNSAASTSTDNQVTYDITPPTVTINQAGVQADPTNVASIAFTIVFSEAINPATFTGADVAITGTAGGTKSVALSTSNNITWTATVTGMTSSGTVLANIAANAAQDPAGNNSAASTSTDNQVTFDNTAPTVTVNQAVGQADPTNVASIAFAVQFSEPINPATFTGADVTITGTAGGTKSVALSTADNRNWTATVTGMTSTGTVIANIAANAAQDPAGNNSAASTSTDNQVTYDITPPTVTINQAGLQADPTNVASIAFTIVFSEAINPATFTGSDVAIIGTAGGTKSVALSTSDNQTWTATVTGMTSTGTVIANIAVNAAQDPAGNNSAASTSTDNQVTFDNTVPTVIVNQAGLQADPTNVASIAFTIVFSEAINPATFTGADVAITGTAGGTKSVALSTSNNITWTATVTGMTSTGTVLANIAANAAQDPAGNNNTASTSTDNQVLYDITPPNAPVISGASPTNDTTPTWSWNSGGGGNGNYQYQLDGTAGAWMDTLAESFTPGTPLPEGPHTLYVRERDDAWNWSANGSHEIVIDLGGPTGTILVENNAVYATSLTVTLNLTYYDAGIGMSGGLSGMRFSNDTVVWGDWETPAATITWTLTPGEGLRTVYAQYRDAFGNVSTADIHDDIFLDTAGPSGTIVIDGGAAYTPGNNVPLTLTFVETGSGMSGGQAGMRFSNDNVAWDVWQAPAPSASWTLTSGDGEKTVWAQFRDAAGNLSTAALSDTVYVDTAAPDVPDAPADAGAWSTTATLTFVWDPASDNGGSGVDYYTWEVSSDPAFASIEDTGMTPGLSCLFTGLDGDTYYCRVQATDLLSHTSAFSSPSDGITVDTGFPSGTIVIAGGDTYTNSLDVALVLSASDGAGSGVVLMRLSNDTVTWTGWEGYATSFPWTLDTGDGEKTVYVQFRDLAGNESMAVFDTIILDTTPPTMICLNPTISLDAGGAASIQISDVDGGCSDSGSGIASMNLSRTDFSCADFPDASTILSATDTAGNTGQCTASVHVTSTYLWVFGPAPASYVTYSGDDVTLSVTGCGGDGIAQYAYTWWFDAGMGQPAVQLTHNANHPSAGGTMVSIVGESGAIGSSMTLDNLQPGAEGSYFAMLHDTSMLPMDMQSAVVSIQTRNAVSIPAPDPVNGQRNVGDSYEITAPAQGGYPQYTYQWEYSPDGIAVYTPLNDGDRAGRVVYVDSGATLRVDTLAETDSGFYRVSVHDIHHPSRPECAAGPNGQAQLLVTEPLQVSNAAPDTAVIYTGENIAFQVTASGGATHLTGDYRYAWLHDGLPMANGGPFSGVGSDTLQITGATLAERGQYACVVTDDSIAPVNNTLTSGPAILSVFEPLALTPELPLDSVVNVGNPIALAVEVVLDVTGTHTGKPLLSYAWQYDLDAGPGENWVALANGQGTHPAGGPEVILAGVDQTELRISNTELLQAGYYRCIVTDGGGQTLTSRAARLSVTDFMNLVIPDGTYAYEGDSPLTITARLYGGIPSFIYEWVKDSASFSGPFSSSDRTDVLDLGVADYGDVGAYMAHVSDSSPWPPDPAHNPPMDSNLGMVYVAPPFDIVTPPAEQYVYDGTNAVFTVSAAGGFEPYSYEWRESGESMGISDQSQWILSPARLIDDGKEYDVIVRDAGSGVTDLRNPTIRWTLPVTLHVAMPISFSVPPAADTRVYVGDPAPAGNGDAPFMLSMEAVGGFRLAAVYAWKRAPQEGPSAGIAETLFTAPFTVDALSYTVNPAAETPNDYYYYVEITELGVTATSPLARVQLAEHVSFKHALGTQELTEGEPFTLHAKVRGGLQPITYQWWKANENNTWEMLPGEDTAALEFSAVGLADSGRYMVEVTDGQSSFGNSITIRDEAIVIVQPVVPALGGIGLAALALSGALGGAFMIRRRRKA